MGDDADEAGRPEGEGAEQPDGSKEIDRRRDNRDRSRYAVGRNRDIQVGRFGNLLNRAG